MKTSVEIEAQGNETPAAATAAELGQGAATTTPGGCSTTTGANQPVISTLEGSGTVIRNGTLGLEAHTALVLNTTCSDVSFENVTFTGTSTVSTPHIGPLQLLDEDLRPQQISLPDRTNMQAAQAEFVLLRYCCTCIDIQVIVFSGVGCAFMIPPLRH